MSDKIKYVVSLTGTFQTTCMAESESDPQAVADYVAAQFEHSMREKSISVHVQRTHAAFAPVEPKQGH